MVFFTERCIPLAASKRGLFLEMTDCVECFLQE
jgi:hypothetical protein